MKKSFLTLITFLTISNILLSGTVYSEEPRRDVIIGFHQMPGPPENASIYMEGGVVKHEYRLIPAVSASLPERAIDTMRKNPMVAYIEDDVILTIVTDEYVNSRGVSHINSEMAHNNGINGTGVKVAVIDTGIDYNHEDLNDNYKGGYDFVFSDSDPFDDSYNSHGTHVAGIIAAERNGIGGVGVSPNASLYAVKVLNGAGFGTVSWVIAGIEWAVSNDMDVVIISSNTEKDSQALHDACRNASDAGVLLVAAAGNTYRRNVTYPARYDSVIAVTATDPDDSHASFSPIGPEVELSAPGVDIRSTVRDGYGNLSGTSQAAPHVAGTAALIISSNLPDVNGDGVVNNEDVRLQLQSKAHDLGDFGRDDTYGYGLVDAFITAAASYYNCGDICVNETGWWRDVGAFNASGAPIRDAVNNASNGATIRVAAGRYNENVDVTADHLTIRSGNGSVSTIVQAANSSDHIFEVTADYVTISGFNVSGANGTAQAGIYLIGANHCNISDNTISSNCNGIYLEDSSNNTLLNNTISGNNYNFGVSGSSLPHYEQNIDPSNTLDGKPTYYRVDRQDELIPLDAGYVGIINSTNITVTNLSLTNNLQGVLFAYTGNSRIENVTAELNYCGIDMQSSSNNTFIHNTADSNNYGIHIYNSSGNTLDSNTASDNSNRDIYIEDSSSTFTDNTLNSTTVSFTYSGDVSLKGVGSPAADPPGRCSIGKFINVMNRSEGAWLYLNFSYSGADVGGPGESSLKVWKFDGTTWLEDGWNGTRYRSAANNVVGVNITSFGVFAPMVSATGVGGSTGSSAGGGRDGTYPPEWFETPTPTMIAIKAPTPTAQVNATLAPPGESVTPVPTNAKPVAEGVAKGDPKKSATDFTAVFAIAGMFAAVYMVVRRRSR